MAVKAGSILHSANGNLIDRIQTGGPGSLNIPQDKVYELGNYQSVAIVRDVPDLSFSLDCLDVDTEIEATLTGADPSAASDGDSYNLANAKTVDIISPWKSPYGEFGIVRGVAIPQLALESASYRYGLSDNAGEQFTLRGDSIYYIPGTPYQDDFTGNGSTTAFSFENGPALLYQESGDDLYALNVSVDGERMTPGDDYTATDTAVTFNTAPANGAKIRIIYGSSTAGTYAQTVHQGISVKPAAIRGKDIDVFFSTAVKVATVTQKAVDTNVATLTTSAAHNLSVGDTITVSGVGAPFDGTFTTVTGTTGTSIKYALTNADVTETAATGTVTMAVEVRWQDVQSCNIDWKVTLEEDREFGNAHAISREATDVPDVTGQIEVKPRSVEALFNRLQQITGLPASQVIGPDSSVAGALRVELRNPGSGGTTSRAVGDVIKTHYIPAARFTIPGYEGRVQQKLTVTLEWQSDDGAHYVYRGARS